jgi:alkylated DNA repair dioxygenase AlkB
VVMRFSRADQFYDLYLQPHSLLILSGQARYEWTHAIPARQSDRIDGIKIMRGRRVSLTFRTVI